MTEIPDEVLDQLESVRVSGAVNMMDRGGVKTVAEIKNHSALVSFIEREGTEGYAQALQELGERRSKR